jgi:HEPN domain-containing protein
VDRKDLQELSRVRLKEATALLKAGLFDGAYYLAGYAVECAIKACIAKGTKRYEFPDKKKADSSYTHSFRELIRVAGLEKALREQADKDPDFQRNWEDVLNWSERSRYQRHPAESAQELVGAIGDRRHGVISWLKLHW